MPAARELLLPFKMSLTREFQSFVASNTRFYCTGLINSSILRSVLTLYFEITEERHSKREILKENYVAHFARVTRIRNAGSYF